MDAFLQPSTRLEAAAGDAPAAHSSLPSSSRGLPRGDPFGACPGQGTG
jgi:hypothetical protein